MNLVNKSDIQKYSHKNTSSKLPIEEKYVNAFIDSILNSTSLSDSIKTLKDIVQDGDAFVLYNSYDISAQNLNREPYRSILAYAMLKKDFRLFELISASIFTGSVKEYHGSDLYLSATKTTDESPLKYTDTGLYTDMTEGLIQIGFKNIFTTEILEDGAGEEYQTLEELEAAIEDFNFIISLTKPARVEVLLFFVPYCYMSGDSNVLEKINMKQDEYFMTPFGPTGGHSVDILNSLTDIELINLYQVVSYKDMETGNVENIEVERRVHRGDHYMTFSYEFRILSNSNPIWKHIQIKSDQGSATFMKSTEFSQAYLNSDPDNQYWERYMPIMLRIEDDDPDGPCLAFQIENDVCTVGALFYVREKEE